MTRLESYLEKNCVTVSCAQSTKSRYYRIGSAIIRYSDHVSIDYSSFDVQIIKPVGSFSCLYMFGVRGNSRFSLMNARQIIDYLPYASMTAELAHGNPNDLVEMPVKEKLEVSKKDNLIESKLLNNNKYAMIVYRPRKPWTEPEINNLPAMMTYEFNRGSGINGEFRKFLRKTSLHYQEFINIYKLIVIDNKSKVTSENLEIAHNMIKSMLPEK
jgi:hypothetical protein